MHALVRVWCGVFWSVVHTLFLTASLRGWQSLWQSIRLYVCDYVSSIVHLFRLLALALWTPILSFCTSLGLSPASFAIHMCAIDSDVCPPSCWYVYIYMSPLSLSFSHSLCLSLWHARAHTRAHTHVLTHVIYTNTLMYIYIYVCAYAVCIYVYAHILTHMIYTNTSIYVYIYMCMPMLYV